MAGRDAGPLLVGLAVLLHTWGAWAIVISMKDKVEVSRGGSANISCPFTLDEDIGNITIHWSYVTRLGDKKEIYYQDTTVKDVHRDTPFTDRIYVTDPGQDRSVVLTINSVVLEDELEFICLIQELTGKVAEGRTRLKVFETPDDPTIEAVETALSVSEIEPSKIGVCEVKNGFPKANITWYRNNMPLRNGGDVKVLPAVTVESTGLISVRSELTKKVVKEDKDAQFHCEISYYVPGVTKMIETDFINVTVLYPSTAVTLWVESPKRKIKEGDTIEIHCQGDGNSPAYISIAPRGSDPVDTSVLVVENATRQNSGTYQCTSMDIETIEEISETIDVNVNYLDPAVVMPSDTIVLARGGHQMATCNALSSLKTETAWFKNREKVSQGHTLRLEATPDTAGTYMCVVTVPDIEEMQTSSSLRVHVMGPPRIMQKNNMEIEESVGNTVDLSCFVGGFPPPNITWRSADGKVLEEEYQTEMEEGVESLVNIKISSDITVFCNASNEYGTDSLTFSIKATKHTTTPDIITTTTTASTTTISSATVNAESAIPPKKINKEGSGVVIAVIIICILLLAILGSVLYFLYKTGKICGRSGKQDLTKDKSNKDNIVVEMKNDNTEEAILLGVNGEKQPPGDQCFYTYVFPLE